MNVFLQTRKFSGSGAQILSDNLALEYSNAVFYSLTDFGICTTLNGEPMLSSYSSNDKVDSLAEMLDPREDSGESLKIAGSGSLHRNQFWLNVANAKRQGLNAGNMVLAINNRLDFTNIRLTIKQSNQISGEILINNVAL